MKDGRPNTTDGAKRIIGYDLPKWIFWPFIIGLIGAMYILICKP
jgi:hypothetical protein